MFDTSPNGILNIATQGESETVEFKLRLPPSDTIGKVIIAFANTNGGILLIGIADNGGIIGLPEDEVGPTIQRLNHISSSLLPVPIQIGSVEIEGRVVVYAVVKPVDSHFAPIMSSRGEIFLRNTEGRVYIPGNSLKGMLRATGERIKPEMKKVFAFVAMSFREEEEPALVDYYHAIERAVKNSKLPIRLKRIDLINGDYEISQKIMDEIDQVEIVIADFTLNSRNVYFELGYARGRNRRIIQMARKGTQLEFDIKNWRTLFYRNATELEEKLVPELRAAFEDLMENGG